MLFLHADTVLSPEWVEAARVHIRRGADKAGFFRLRFDASGAAPAVVARWANARGALGLPYGDQGLLIHRRLYREVGGYRDIPLMEDVAIARALGRRRLAMLDAVAMTSAEKYQRNGWVRQGARNLTTLTRFALGARPETLARSYGR